MVTLLPDVVDYVKLFSMHYGKPPGFVVLTFDIDEDSISYINDMRQVFLAHGLRFIWMSFPNEVKENYLASIVGGLSADDNIQGVYIRLPLPSHINASSIENSINLFKWGETDTSTLVYSDGTVGPQFNDVVLLLQRQTNRSRALLKWKWDEVIDLEADLDGSELVREYRATRMTLGKYSKVDGRKSSSNYCSTVTSVVFVTLCLVGVWMMASSSVVPFQIVETISGNKNYISTIENDGKMINDTSTETTKGSDSKQFEDNPSEGHKLEEPNGYHWKL